MDQAPALSSDLLAETLPLLERLVAEDTRNPPRRIDQGGIFAVLKDALGPSFTLTTTDLGDGCVSLLAVRGAPDLLFNVHVDTVPADAGWQGDPLRLRVEGDRAIGLGACDVKGAAACLAVAARRTSGPVALLFSSDEEAGSSRCVKDFLAKGHGFRRVVVGEPTRCLAVLEHRGIVTATAEFKGTAGHASAPRALVDSAVHEAVRWSSRALAHAEREESRHYKDLSGIRLNLGVIAGGTKANMIASSATVRIGVRPRPDQRPDDVVAELAALAERPERASFEVGFVAPPLPAPGDRDTSSRAADAAAFAASLGLTAGPPVDFWTEAALFSAAGATALVYGPGDIQQAHAPGEHVLLAQLDEAVRTYTRLLGGNQAV